MAIYYYGKCAGGGEAGEYDSAAQCVASGISGYERNGYAGARADQYYELTDRLGQIAFINSYARVVYDSVDLTQDQVENICDWLNGESDGGTDHGYDAL